MVQGKIEDTRSDNHKAKYPWWWRGFPLECGKRELFSTKQNEIAAYNYEMGRRWLHHSVGGKWMQLPAYPELLKKEMNPESGFAWDLLRRVLMDTCKFPGIVEWSGKPLTKKEITSKTEELNYDIGDFVILKNVAWNLNEDWKNVSKLLEIEFKRQLSVQKEQSKYRRKKIYSPPWERLEIWDCWVADIDLEERFDGPEHEKRVSRITTDAKPHGQRLLGKLARIFH
jgi:hypothetical protein